MGRIHIVIVIVMVIVKVAGEKLLPEFLAHERVFDFEGDGSTARGFMENLVE